MWTWQDLTERAEQRHGIVTADEVRATGCSSRGLVRLVEDAHIVAMEHSVYRIGGAPPSFLGRVVAAVEVNGRATWASHATAAAIWRLVGFGEPARLELIRPTGTGAARTGARVHRSNRLPEAHLTTYRGVPVTTPARTIFDLARATGELRLGRALDGAIRDRRCTVAAVHAVIAELGGQGRPGTRRMRAVLAERQAEPTDSELERLARAVFAEAGLPEPCWQADLSDEQGWIGRVDALFSEARVVVELDGSRWHDQLSDRRHDASRDRRLTAAGYLVVRFRWHDLTERPEAVVAELGALLAARCRQGAA